MTLSHPNQPASQSECSIAVYGTRRMPRLATGRILVGSVIAALLLLPLWQSYAQPVRITPQAKPLKTGTFKDPRDGNVYKIIVLAKQTWFAENVSYKPPSGKHWAYGDNEDNATKYGRLYDWNTARTVCAAGWHLASDDEWTALTTYLGGEGLAGGKMKATVDWFPHAEGHATNESGFNAMPAGCRCNGSFSNLGAGARFWSGTPATTERAFAHMLGYGFGLVVHLGEPRTDAYSVRCVQD
jgi:uncharacterized protein (TIGR02145 family)